VCVVCLGILAVCVAGGSYIKKWWVNKKDMSLREELRQRNDENWQSYIAMWQEAKDTPSVQRAFSCKEVAEQTIWELPGVSGAYEGVLTKQLNDVPLASEDRTTLRMYKLLEDLKESLTRSVQMFDREEPYLQSGIFYYLDSPSVEVTGEYVEVRARKIEQTLDYYGDVFAKEARRLDDVYCSDFANLSYEYPWSKSVCVEFVKALNSLDHNYPPVQKENQTELEYKLALKEYENGQEREYSLCNYLGD
jgi:hypothetical protein